MILNMIPKEVLDLINPIDFKSIWELGNKKTGDGFLYRTYYEDRGIEYDCIDWNGKDGAHKLNLNEKHIYLSQRDIVTNFGVTEHVDNQRMVFENIHNLSNNRIVHWVPMIGSRNNKHGFYRYDHKFFELLEKLNNYEVLKSYTISLENKLEIICKSYRKKSNDSFVWSDELFKYVKRIR